MNDIVDTLKGFVGVYQVFFKSGLCFPTFDFLEVILDYYHLHITQITPNAFQKIICFAMLCFALEIVPSITFFYYFYIPISNGDWISFSFHHGLVEIYDALPTSIKYWKEEYILFLLLLLLGL